MRDLSLPSKRARSERNFFPAVLSLPCFLLAVLPAVLQAYDVEFVGSEECRPCYENAYKIWRVSTHAHTFERLPTDRQRELRCLFCHATDTQRSLIGYRLLGVQCEACHGPGARHVRLAIEGQSRNPSDWGLVPVTEKTCAGCHSGLQSSSLHPFDYERTLKSIRHW